MANERHITEPEERDAVLGLWSVPGIGPVTLDAVRALGDGRCATFLDVSPAEWADGLELRPAVRAWLRSVGTLREAADWVKDRARQAGMILTWRGDPEYPELLDQIADPPPVLFRFGKVGVRRRRVAMVGSRMPEGGFLTWAARMAQEVAASGVGVVSGAALGVDRACHLGALEAGGETWAFLGSALDEVDPAQRRVAEEILEGDGCVWSELPPQTRADKTTFPRRNRLISGSSDATVILRAAKKSGTLITAKHARSQGRPVLAVPGNPWLAEAQGANLLIQNGEARLCLGEQDLFTAVELVPERVAASIPPGRSLAELAVSKKAEAALAALEPKRPRLLEDVLASSGLDPLTGVIALAELECAGLLVQHPGRLYERV